MKNGNSIIPVLLCVFFMLTGTAESGHYSEIKFREFSRDRDIFERYTEYADKSLSADEWQSILDTGKEEMTALWEKNALAECDRYIREGYDSGEVTESMEEARARWESDFDDALLYRKGAWRASQEASVYSPGKMTSLKERVYDAGNAVLADSAAWDIFVAGTVQETEGSWADFYYSEIENLYIRADPLDGKEKEGFIAEAGRIENELMRDFNVEKGTILYLGKSGFIEKKNFESSTLRDESEQKSAAVITDNILSDTLSDIRSEEEKIIRYSYSDEGGTAIDFSGAGENWQENLKRLIDYGMTKWESARERLYNELISWKKTAEEAFSTAEAKWREGMLKLEAARLEWEKNLTTQIYAGLKNWESDDRELKHNIQQSREDFASYMESMSAQWSDSNRDLVDMAVNGSAIYAGAVDNIKWLEGMVESTKGQYAFSAYNDEFKAAAGEEMQQLVQAAVEKADRYIKDYYDSVSLNNATYTNKIEIIFKQAGLPGYNTETESYTEKYVISIVNHIYATVDQVYGKTITYEERRFSEDISWDNIVTSDTPSVQRSDHCYYIFELERWKLIRDSFSTIALDAELYMHNQNMAGEEKGAGYLTNAAGDYATNTKNNSSDPYLMTQAEYNLELASRDRDFWERRLDIAKAVLDYADGTTNETAAQTGQNKEDAEAAMEKSKAEYNKALGAVNKIVAELKVIQGMDPGDLNYNESIEYLTTQYNEARVLLDEAEKRYTVCKTAFILLENGESPDYIRNEIIEIERNLLKAEQEAQAKRKELYAKQNEADYAERTAVFSQLYSSAVKDYEEAKDTLDLFFGIVNGYEDGSLITEWTEGLLNNKEALWGGGCEEESGRLTALMDAYNKAAGPERELKKEQVLACIRNIYFRLYADAELKKNIIEVLHDDEFVPEDFLRSEYTGDHGIYGQYAGYSTDALEIIDECFDLAEDTEGGDKSYSGVLEYLNERFKDKRYVYGADNSGFIVHYIALKYFKEKYRGLSAESWGAYRNRLASEWEAADSARKAHRDMADGDAYLMFQQKELEASEGDMDAVLWLREYYAGGSTIAGLEYIMEYDCSIDAELYIQDSLWEYVAENSYFFYNNEKFMQGHNYLAELYGFIKSKSGIGENAGGNPFSVEVFSGMTAYEISIAAGMVQKYVESLESAGVPVPDSIRSVAESMSSIKEGLDKKLFILSYMNGLLEGSPDEIFIGASETFKEISGIEEFLTQCGELISSSTDDLYLAGVITGAYDKLSHEWKEYLQSRTGDGVMSFDRFMAELNTTLFNAELADYEEIYSLNAGNMTPAQQSLLIPENMRERFIADMTPVYETTQYDIALSEGRVDSIELYVETRDLDTVTASQLRAYALITHYMENSTKSAGCYDSSFEGYNMFKSFEEFICETARIDGESNSDYIDRCVNSFIQSNGGEASELTDFAVSYLDSEITSYSFLPDEVKVYLAQQFYYDNVYGANKSYHDIEGLLAEEYGRDSISDNIVDAVSRYAGRLNAVLFFTNGGGRKATAGIRCKRSLIGYTRKI